ncbi:MAG: HEAT repeat domain-containing protein [Desulfuromonadaceae bacterium]|nr:HEAT repeat domain-containing protein [Desulfuromonadaceae bacterium]
MYKLQIINLKLFRRAVSATHSGMKEKVRSRIEAIRPLLKDPEPEVRIAAAEAIEALEKICSVEDILATLKTGNMGARIGAIYALGEVGGERVLSALVYCARRPEVDIRAAAAAVLGRLALPAALPVLGELLDDENPAVQGRAIEALRNFSVTSDIIDKLRIFLSASDGVLEAEAALTLAELRDLYSLSQIQALLISPHSSTRLAAATALSRMPL